MKLIITRHGETEENRNRIIQGHLDGTLSELGLEQARKLAERLKDEKLDRIFSSDLARARDTAKEIAKFHEDIPLELVKDLRERYLGILQGKKSNPEWRANKSNTEYAKRLQMETPEEVFNRAKDFVSKILKENKGRTVLFVAHNGINMVLIIYLFGKTFQDIKDLEYLKNTSVSIFKFDNENKPVLKLLNCVKHLEG